MKTMRKKRWWIWIVLGIVLLPVVNLLMAGPFVYLTQREIIPEKVWNSAMFPIEFGHRHRVFEVLGVEGILDHYLGWWMQKADEAHARARQKQRN
jgi:hypothetical protein